MDAAGVDLILVGDSWGVVQGHSGTLPVTLDQMVYHAACAARGVRRAVLAADLPFMSYASIGRRWTARPGWCASGRADGEAGRRAQAPGSRPRLAGRIFRSAPISGCCPQSVHKLGGYLV
ncbi:Ketopantoate hydroxymethyltransferase, partial [Methylomagnum ishizawai]